MQQEGKAGDTVELKDKEAGFSDYETGFDISRDQHVKLGDTVGARTQQAIMSGGLLIVGAKSKKAAEDDDTPDETPKGKGK